MTVPVAAMPALKVQPLLYEERLASGEIKKGFIDVSNPTTQTLNLTTAVEAFRQIDDQGNLEFYKSEAVSAGLTPDFAEFELGPHQAMRLMFEVDGSKLPSGDVFAALFVSSETDEPGNIAQKVRVGTLFVLENGAPGARQAEISQFSSQFLHTGSQISGSYKIKNLAEAGQASGFIPEVELSLWPFGETIDAPSSLVFAGHERQNHFQINTDKAGIYKLSLSFGDSTKSQWLLLLPGWFIGTLGGLAGLVVIGLIWRWRRKIETRPKPKLRR